MRQEEIEKVIDSMPYVFSAGNENFVLTGTFLLSIFNLIDKYGDVDILVVDSDKDFWSELLYKYENKIIDKSMWYYGIKIKINDIVFNFIRDDDYSIEMDSTNVMIGASNIYLDSIQHALQAKHNLKRDKDKLHFVEINEKLNSLIQ